MQRTNFALVLTAFVIVLLGAGSAEAQRRGSRSPQPAPSASPTPAPEPVVPPPAEAVPAASTQTALQQAEEAYIGIDFEGVRNFATQALAEGGHTPAEVVRIYKLLGMAYAALGQQEPANRAFVRMLMLAPNEEVTELSPELRSSYLEARGRVSALAQRFGVTVSLSLATNSLVIRVADPTRLAVKIAVGARAGEQGEFRTAELQPSDRVTHEVAGLNDAGYGEYWLSVLDEHGNVLLALGSAEEPETIGQRRVRGPEDETSILSSPWFWTAVGVVLVGGGIGTYFAVRDPGVNGQTSVCFSCR